jgi:hypothetical protein
MEIWNMEHTIERTKKQKRKEAMRKIEAQNRASLSDGDLMKYYRHNESAGSPNDRKRHKRLLGFERRAEEGRQ